MAGAATFLVLALGVYLITLMRAAWQPLHAHEPACLSPGQAANAVRLLQADTSFTSDVSVHYKSKLSCEFQNDADRSINVRTSSWTPGASGIQARVLKATLQILIEDYWCPPKGANELDVPPSGRFRTWIGLVVSENSEAEVKRWIAANALGTIELVIDGRKVQWKL
jgi:hypothetical protein